MGERIDKVERDPYIVGADAISTTKEELWFM
ncbi:MULTISPECIES: glycerol-3-phosphate responsive antiterminator [Lacrimispora]|nr:MULTISPECIES: glycerol-3-phosphate responsive antiterminator [Lacrimispora]